MYLNIVDMGMPSHIGLLSGSQEGTGCLAACVKLETCNAIQD